ncbi:MAG: DHA2 family efflux MFS transporter permease subunit [Chlorobium sp.]|uniref:DHA2 family efflux MFS transporter permease subunit n=1 Tax=Chlorobium sp. TaxID=1095 RepID=UPI0025C386AA|nr:DHA2 family efflux MFS transporter permease subunit [Chlorobium sp.]MCF8216373.1 DHA2 family efflux MFS transporter permease subunit [Chlorobium sp.]MCF8271276.1 DHA2 family efflux MFS transporter permease subunit [Chlorobium sp.]MCF8287650.1 DHA2 family efflux MFS transporter permease subunit [Chlorobium sp.]MCF8291189.1 DHA2 family efflux MFS transporter permease subunit [Chlorobium sp.]MCF8385284.1 DHA2 family efflux MFS transporter permease subunit [Chlorobium sp.]
MSGTATAASLQAGGHSYETGARRVIITLTVIVSAMLELIDTTIVNVAITQISGNLGASIEDVAWVVTSYAIANVIVIPLSGFLGNLLGRRTYYIGSILLFTVASLLCGLATDIWALVFFRFLQGIGGGALLPTSQAILYETYPPEDRGKATGIFSMGLVLGPTIGPLLGGYLVDYLSWEWCFFVNIPIGLLAAWSSYAFIREPKTAHKVTKIDWTGIGLLAAGIGSLQFILERGESKDWFETSYITWFTIIAVVSLLLFVWWELRTEEPAVDLRVLARSHNLAIAAVLTFIVGYGLYGSLFVFPVFVQHLLGFTAVLTGLVLFPSALVTGVISMPLGIALQRGASPKILMTVGMGAFALFCWELGQQTMQSGAENFFWILLLRGVALGFIFIPVTMLAVSGLHGKDIGQATGLNNMVRQLGGSFGIALTNTYIAKRVAAHRADMLGSLSPYDPAAIERLEGIRRAAETRLLSPVEAEHAALKALEGTVTAQSYHLAYMDAFMLIAALFALSMPLLFFIKLKKGEKADLSQAH